MNWTVAESRLDRERITTNGNKYMIGNGFMGYRGTLEEFGKEQLVACTIAGLYDKVGDTWREPVNAPNGLYTKLYCDDSLLSVLDADPEDHTQELHIRDALHKRATVFAAPDANRVTYISERLVSADNLHLIAMKFTVQSERDCQIVIETGIDGDVWDINGPHLEELVCRFDDGILRLDAVTHQLRMPVTVAESFLMECGEQEIVQTGDSILRRITFTCEAGRVYEFVKFVSVITGMDAVDNPGPAAVECSRQALQEGFDSILGKHRLIWDRYWKMSDVRIEGDDEAQFALRYSIYQLLIIAPTASEKVSIPARGLSGQVYKGAVFWDTEMFMLPFFLYTNPEAARNIMMYRSHTLDGARRKAAEYGFEGAYYAWESQDSGDDACTLFNITDVFTNRPMRTYFRDKQIHISADVAHGIWQYYLFTEDDRMLLEGGAEAILECARFFCSYAYFKPDKARYEMLDVTGPDEYHERVHNNAFTNYMVKQTLATALQVVQLLQDRYPEALKELVRVSGGGSTVKQIREIHDNLYVPEPDSETGLIEQFDGYFRLEDLSVKELKSRMLHPNEYLGGGTGLARLRKY
jgi:nigerose phosphorylase